MTCVKGRGRWRMMSIISEKGIDVGTEGLVEHSYRELVGALAKIVAVAVSKVD